MKDDDASEYEIKGFAVLIRCLGVYFQIMLHFVALGTSQPPPQDS